MSARSGSGPGAVLISGSLENQPPRMCIWNMLFCWTTSSPPVIKSPGTPHMAMTVPVLRWTTW